MIVEETRAKESIHLVLYRHELQRLVEILENPKRRVSKEAKQFGAELREAIRVAHAE